MMLSTPEEMKWEKVERQSNEYDYLVEKLFTEYFQDGKDIPSQSDLKRFVFHRAETGKNSRILKKCITSSQYWSLVHEFDRKRKNVSH